MFDLDGYLSALVSECRAAFGGRLLYVGLQGSYMRGEAKEDSDIDVMVLLDSFSVRDMDEYREILRRIGRYEKSCGFLCGRDEMARWDPQEVCQLRHTTKDLYGTLAGYLPEADRKAEIDYVKISLGNLYHELCHRYVHASREANEKKFRGTCKGLFFLIQNLFYLESGTFAATKRELKALVSEEDRAMLEMAELPDGYDFDRAFAGVFRWCGEAFGRVSRIDPGA